MLRDRAGLWLMIFLSGATALVSFRFLILGLPVAFGDLAEHLPDRWWSFVLHVVAAPVALFFGALQFMPGIRARRPIWHRWSGRLYVAAVMVGGLSGLVLGFNSLGGPVASAGFVLLAVFWMLFTWQGLRMARARRYVEHRQWMIRSFALTFAAVTLRLYLVLFGLAGFEYAAAAVYLGWICWVPNLLFAQWWLRRAQLPAGQLPATSMDTAPDVQLRN